MFNSGLVLWETSGILAPILCTHPLRKLISSVFRTLQSLLTHLQGGSKLSHFAGAHGLGGRGRWWAQAAVQMPGLGTTSTWPHKGEGCPKGEQTRTSPATGSIHPATLGSSPVHPYFLYHCPACWLEPSRSVAVLAVAHLSTHAFLY